MLKSVLKGSAALALVLSASATVVALEGAKEKATTAKEATNNAAALAIRSPIRKKPWSVMKPDFSVDGQEATLDVSEGTWMSVDVSPDGKMIAFDMLGDIYLMPITGGEAKNISSGVQWDMQPRFSPDGSKIAFTSDRAGGDNIWVMDVDGSNPKQLSEETFTLLNNPTWSKDGKYIAARKHFTTTRSLGTGEIWMYHIDGGDGIAVVKRPNKQYQKELGEPMFSADGSKIFYTQNMTRGNIFSYTHDSNTEVFNIRSVDLTTGEVEKVAGGAGGAVRATPSPDGKWLAFVRRVRADSRLFLRNLETGAEHMIYDSLDQDMQETWAVQGVYPNMDWTPDSKSIVFWSGGKINRIEADSGAVSAIPFKVKDTRTVYKAPKFKVDVSPATFDTKMVRFASPAPDGKSVVFESLGKLWIKRGDDAPSRLTKDSGDHFELYPVWSNDGSVVYFSTWDDQAGGDIRGVKVSRNSRKSKVLSDKNGHYTDLSISPDGDRILYRKSRTSSLLKDGGIIDAGLYVMPAKGGKPSLITKEGALPFEGKDGRVYYSVSGALKSVTMQGYEARTVATAKYGNNFRLSPTGDYVTWIANYHAYVAPLPKIGTSVSYGTKTGGLPVQRLTKTGGLYLDWTKSGDGLYWSLGAELKTAKLVDVFADDYKTPTSGVNMSMAMPSDTPDTMLAITGARIITMNGTAQVIETGTVLIENNRITAIGAAADVTIPDGAKVIDAAGKTIIPGLIDIHAHGPYASGDTVPQQNWNAQGHLALGVTTIHNPSSSAKTAFAAAEYQMAGKIIAPRIFSTAEIIYGAKSSYFVGINGMDDALAAVRRLKAQGAISVKNYNQPRRNQRQQVVEAARQEGLMVVAEGGSLYHMDMNMVVDGNTGIEHNIPVQKAYSDVFQLWGQTDVGYTPTLNVGYGAVRGEAYFYQETEVWKHPILENYVPPKILQAASVRREKSPMADYGFPDQVKLADQLMQKGVTVSIGAHGQREGLGSHWAIWQYKMGGMSAMDALKVATSNPARYMGMDADIGSLETGKLADLLILDGNPLEDIMNTQKIYRVMLNGRLYNTDLSEMVTGDYKQKPFYWQGKPESDIR